MEMDISSRTKQITDLVAQAQTNPADFGLIYQEYIQSIYKYIYSRVGNQQDAEDLTSQTFTSALQSLHKYRNQGYFSAWLFTIARNKVRDFYRNNKHEIDVENIDNLNRYAEDIHAQVERSLDVERLSRLVRGLKEEEQELIRLRYLAELPFAEIARVVGKKEDAVKKALYRLLDRLEGQMEVENE